MRIVVAAVIAFAAGPDGGGGDARRGDACGALDTPACAALAEKMRIDDGLDKGSPALPLFAALCERDYGDGCLVNALFDEKDDARVVALVTKACDLSAIQACAALGQMVQFGRRGLTVDPSRALRLYERGCALGDSYACYVASGLYQGKEPGYPKDLKRSRTLERLAGALGRLAPHEEEERAKALKGPLFCAALSMVGLRFPAFACARDAAGCAQLAKEIVAATPAAEDASIEACEPNDESMLLYCAIRADKPACSAQRPFCEKLLSSAATKRSRRPPACVRYRRGPAGGER